MNSYSCCFSSTYVTTYPSFLCGPPSSSSSSSITNLRRPGCGDRGVDRTTSCVLGVSCSPFDGSSQNPRLLLIFPNGAKEKRLAKPNFFFFHERYPLLQHRIFKGQLKDNPNGPTLLPPMSHPRCPDLWKKEICLLFGGYLINKQQQLQQQVASTPKPPQKKPYSHHPTI